MPSAFHPVILLAVASGGAIGALTRHTTAALMTARQLASWQATLSVNILGSLLIGILAATAASGNLSPVWRAALITGFLGSLTTFSTYSLDSLNFIRDDRIGAAVAYAVGGLLVGLAAAAAGWHLQKFFIK